MQRSFPAFQDVIKAAAGDTIVEVLISLSVLASALGVSYGIANRALNSSRDAQEHTQAVMIAQAQLEFARQTMVSSNGHAFSGGHLFCFDSSGAVVTFTTISSLPPLDEDNFSHYPPACANINSLYNASVNYNSDNDNFSATVRWYRLGGGRDQVLLIYRIHAPPTGGTSPSGPPPPPPPSLNCPSFNLTVSGTALNRTRFLYYNAARNHLTYTAGVSTPAFDAGCNYYIAITTEDLVHPEAGHIEPNESLAVRFLRSNNTQIAATGLTCDVRHNATTMTTTFGSTFSLPSLPQKVELDHYETVTGDSSSDNSLDTYAKIFFSTTPFTGDCLSGTSLPGD
ncbi:MAG TPA: hypothetical protein VHD60_01285 [Candidatus Saccharimonadales bacterium]|nr:hypothetical protein [Candidatus Saccharimonadales bacterium]